jgi:hypothetical protein
MRDDQVSSVLPFDCGGVLVDRQSVRRGKGGERSLTFPFYRPVIRKSDIICNQA